MKRPTSPNLLVFALVMASCSDALWQTPESVPASVPRDDTLEWSDFPGELPSETVGTLASGASYRGWDYNGDGRVDRLEILDAAGNVSTVHYDFDFDGKPDLTRNPAITPPPAR